MPTLAQLRSLIQTSIHGRRLGIDRDGFLQGHPGERLPMQTATSDTTGTQLDGYGYIKVTTTTNDGWILKDPTKAGHQVTLMTGTTSTGTHTITTAAAVIISSGSGSATVIALAGGKAAITLVADTTARWLVKGDATGSVTLSTV